MRFHYYDSLRVFVVVARHDSLAAAAGELNLTKGAVSYQVRRLEQTLGFDLFARHPRGIVLTSKGHDLWLTLQHAFEAVEARIAVLRDAPERPITIGMTTYFASRWLSPRLMMFMGLHPRIRIRIQPMIDLSDLQSEGIDLAIRWGRGEWEVDHVHRLFLCPSFATGTPEALRMVQGQGLAGALAHSRLLSDRSGSAAWADWHRVAGLPFHPRTDILAIPDPNLRVQAVIDGQGIALNDVLAAPELESGRLVRLSDHQLDEYGYFLVHGSGALSNPDVAAFAQWIIAEAGQADRNPA